MIIRPSNSLLAWILLGMLCMGSTADADIFSNIVREVKRGGKNVGKTIEKGVSDTTKTAGKAIHDIGKATGKAAEDARKTIEKGLQDASRTAGKAGKDIAVETVRVGPHAVDLGKALGNYLARNVQGRVDAVYDANRRLREGKILDAMFHAALDPLTAQEEAAFLATQESGWLNTAGAAAASAYGGPGGAAAYASWQTYRASGGNAELALRAGVITGLASAAMSGVGGMGGATAPEAAKKAALAGAVGGLAIAASGGDADQIRDGFILGGGMILIQEGYKNFTGHQLDAKGATGDPYCMSPSDPSCETLRQAYSFKDDQLHLDTSKLDNRASFVGIGWDPSKPNVFGSPDQLGSDQSALMRTLARVPGMNAMGLFHDKWVVSWEMSALQNKATIFPAIVLTYMGTGAALSNEIAETVAAKNSADEPGSSAAVASNALAGNTALPPLELAARMLPFMPGAEPWHAPIMDSTEVYFGLHSTAPYYSVLYVRNMANGRLVRVTVIGSISEADKANGISLRLASRAVKDLAPASELFWVETEYEDVTQDSFVVTPNGDGREDRLVFNNLRNGHWRLWAWHESSVEFKTEQYKNDWGDRLPMGIYNFYLENVSRGQLQGRPYRGKFLIAERHGWLGLRGWDVPWELVGPLGLPRPIGALVTTVVPGGPAARVGIRTGDVIVKFDGKEIADMMDLLRHMGGVIGREVEINLVRDRRLLALRIHVEPFPSAEELARIEKEAVPRR